MPLKPFNADIGNQFPDMLSGAALVSVLLGLDTTGPMLL
jgi:peptide/nickel transport system permease protein